MHADEWKELIREKTDAVNHVIESWENDQEFARQFIAGNQINT